MRLEFARPWVRSPAGLRCVFSSDPAVSSSIFVGAEREDKLIRNDPDKSEFTIVSTLNSSPSAGGDNSSDKSVGHASAFKAGPPLRLF